MRNLTCRTQDIASPRVRLTSPLVWYTYMHEQHSCHTQASARTCMHIGLHYIHLRACMCMLRLVHTNVLQLHRSRTRTRDHNAHACAPENRCRCHNVTWMEAEMVTSRRVIRCVHCSRCVGHSLSSLAVTSQNIRLHTQGCHAAGQQPCSL